MRYWLRALLGIVLSAAAVSIVAWCTYAWTRTSLCTPVDTQLACRLDGEAFLFVILGAIFVLIPLASQIFMRRTRPRGTPLGFLALSLALTAAGGAALVSAIGSGSGTPADIPGFVVGGILLSIGPIALVAGIATTGSRGAARLAQAQRDAIVQQSGGDLGKAMAAVRAGTAAGSSVTFTSGATAGDAAQPGAGQLGALAAQLSQIAEARQHTTGDATAASLRQLDDLRASGLLTPEEHARKRREILDKL
jgi:hypothetical protein